VRESRADGEYSVRPGKTEFSSLSLLWELSSWGKQGIDLYIKDCPREVESMTKTRADEMRDQWMSAILETLQDLPQMERDVFVLNRYRSLGLDEIGAKLSISVAHAESLLSGATEKLMSKLNATVTCFLDPDYDRLGERALSAF
jgi:hypothetical protein